MPSAFEPDEEGLAPKFSAELQGSTPSDAETSAETSASAGGGVSPLPTTLNRAEAYAALQRAVTELRSRGRRSVAAGLKTELKRMTAGGFDEGALGFSSFRSFLEAAAEAQIVQLIRPAPGSGQDLEVVAIGQAIASRPLPGGNGAQRPPHRRIRQDLWNAFVDHDPTWFRVFDRSAGVVRFFPKDPVPLEPQDVAAQRQRYAESPDQFAIIEFIPQETKKSWMKEFIDGLHEQDAMRRVLGPALETDRPLTSFVRAVRGTPELGRAWTATFAERVGVVIEEWLSAHGIDLDPYLEVPSPQRRRSNRVAPTQPTARAEKARSPESRSGDDGLRDQLFAVLNQLSTDELLQLRVPIVYALRR